MKSVSIVIDTNAFLRFLLNDVPQQKKEVDQLLKQARNDKIQLIVPQIVIFELNFILDKYYNFPKEEVIDKLTALVSASYLQVESNEVFLEALAIYKSTQISLPDCFLAAKAYIESTDLFTFDQQLKKMFSSL
jgi:predicted nucleic-acid-binding protein